MALTQPPDDASGRYIVVLKDGVDDPGQVAAEISRRNNAEVGSSHTATTTGTTSKVGRAITRLYAGTF